MEQSENVNQSEPQPANANNAPVPTASTSNLGEVPLVPQQYSRSSGLAATACDPDNESNGQGCTPKYRCVQQLDGNTHGSLAARAPSPPPLLPSRDGGGDAPGGASAATVVAQLRERHGTQWTPTPFAQAPFRIHSDARLSSVM